jgi:hypothetical protein
MIVRIDGGGRYKRWYSSFIYMLKWVGAAVK